MKILQLGKFYPIRGGVEKVMWDFTRGLSGRGIPCDMLCTESPGKNAHTIHLNPLGRVICTKSKTKIAATMISTDMIRWVREHCNEYDIIHIHHPDPMACLALFLSGYKGKVVVHWHSDILKQRFLLKFYKPLQDWMLRRASLIIGTTPVYVHNSPHLKKYQDKVTYLPIGVEKVRISENQVSEFKKQYPGKKIIFSMGRLIGYKGYQYLVGSAKYLSDDYIILIGGQGPLRDELQGIINMNNLAGKVKLLGYLEEAEVPVLFGSCDLFTMSSVWKTEAFGIVQIEAMSCGKPVVVTKIPDSGVSWVNEDGVSGLNVPIENSRALAEAFMKIADNPENLRKFSAGALKRYEEMFTFDKMIDTLIEKYKSL